MGTPAIVRNNRVVGTCPSHQRPAPNGSPTPAGPLPFSAPLRDGLVDSVLIGGQPAAVEGSTGTNAQVHGGLHASDSYAVSSRQIGTVESGSRTVLIDGKPAATLSSRASLCSTPGSMADGVRSVLIG
ncbi:hypothetical protein BH23CHL7_BH23CHL7_23530 [soil metagenome]